MSETCNKQRVLTRCRIEIAPAIRRIRDRNPGVAETPGGRPNMGRLENHISRGVCRKEAFGGSERRRTENFWGGSAQFGPAPVGNEPEKTESYPPTMSHQVLDSLEGYLDNIAAAATQTAATGTPLAELAARPCSVGGHRG